MTTHLPNPVTQHDRPVRPSRPDRRSRHDSGDQHDRHDRWNALVRNETPAQRLDRNYGEILQELRIAQTGVQLLLAFQLALAFTPRFGSLNEGQRWVYVSGLVLGAAAAALLMAPAAFHRLVFQRRLKPELVRASNRFALSGLLLLVLSLGASVLLILDVVLGARPAGWITAGTTLWFGLWWFAVPLASRRRHRHRMLDGQPRPSAGAGAAAGFAGDVDPGVHVQLDQDV
jgi:hypothetical protein